MTVEITKETARRYLLGRSGLWPGRRWAGKEGAEAAVRALGGVQIDPLNITARNHDLVLQARVLDYAHEQLDALLYRERRFFDYGELLFLYPMEELPHWRLHMRRRGASPRWSAIARQHASTLDAVREELRARGPLGNRDFAGTTRVNSYRGNKDTGLALYYLWITGELMTHGRRNFERLFHHADTVVPADPHAPTDEETEAYFARKTLQGFGLATTSMWSGSLSFAIARSIGRTEARRRLDELIECGMAVRVAVEGVREPYLAPADELPLIESLARGETPRAWLPLAATTEKEVTLIAPLDTIVHNRQRAMNVFDFEYLWEVYKPAPLRRWGYYTLPILWGDRLVARLDPKLERKSGVLSINGFWVEDDALLDDPAFADALGKGLARFMRFLGAKDVGLDAMGYPVLVAHIEQAIERDVAG